MAVVGLWGLSIITIPSEVVFTSDNIFCKVQTWLHEANPDLWLLALESLRKLDEEVFVPGHGPVTGKSYLDEQGSFILEWKDYVKGAIDQAMTAAPAAARLQSNNRKGCPRTIA